MDIWPAAGKRDGLPSDPIGESPDQLPAERVLIFSAQKSPPNNSSRTRGLQCPFALPNEPQNTMLRHFIRVGLKFYWIEKRKCEIFASRAPGRFGSGVGIPVAAIS